MQQAAMRRCFHGLCERVEQCKEMTRLARVVLSKWRAPALELCWHAWHDFFLSCVQDKVNNLVLQAEEAVGKLKLETVEAALVHSRQHSTTALEKSEQDFADLMGKFNTSEQRQHSLERELATAEAERESAKLELKMLKEASDSKGLEVKTYVEQLSALRGERDGLKAQLDESARLLEDVTIQARSCEAERDMAMAQLASATDALEDLAHYLPSDA